MGFGNSGGGSGSIASSSDVALNNPTDTQVLSYDSSISKWKNIQSPAASVTSVAGKTGAVTLTKTDIGLENVDNTADADKPVSTATQALLNNKAPLVSPAFTGTPTAPTQVPTQNDTTLATTAFVQAAVNNVASGAPLPGVVLLDSFAGATDDDKLTAALTFAQAQTQKPAIMMPNRLVTFTQSRTIFDGMKIVGPPVVGFQNVERSSGGLNPTRVRLDVGTDGAAWLIAPTSGGRYNVVIRDIAFESTNSASQFIHYPVAVGTLFSCTFHNLDFNGFKHVFGSLTSSCAITLCTMSGDWTITNPKSTQLHLAGSDNVNMWVGGALNIGAAGSGTLLMDGQYLARFLTAKSNIGNIYFTADDNWRALLLDGNATYQAGNNLSGFVVEGRNAADPAVGALIHVKGGGWSIRDTSLNYAMASPTTLSGSPDRGYIQHTGGELHLSGITVDRATGVSETVPIVYSTGGELIARGFRRSTKGGSWTGRPRVQQPSAGFIIDTDPTVTLINQAASSLYINSAEGGAAGSAVTTANSGGSSGSAFSTVTVGSGSAALFSSAQAANSSALSYSLSGAGNEDSYVSWGSTNDAGQKASSRFYFRVDSLPSVVQPIMQFRSSGGGTGLLSLCITTAGKLRVTSEVASVTVFDTTGSINVSTWYGVEVQLENPTTSTGTVKLITYDASDAIISNLGATASAQNFGTSAIGTMRVGKIGTSGAYGLFVDDIAFRSGDSTAIGPV